MSVTITQHAMQRMMERGINEHGLKTVLAFGRKCYTKGAVYYAVGRKEVRKYGEQEPLLKRLEGIQVVTSVEDHVYRILTVFKNHCFKSLRK